MIVYIAGDMHSGTTLVGQLIASRLGATVLGEVGPTLAEYQPLKVCDCGRPVTSCEVWSTVESGASARHAVRDAYQMARTPAQFMRVLLNRVATKERVVTDSLRGLAAAVDGILVDTSKIPSGLLLWRLAGQEVVVVHCVRNPGGVARSKANPHSAAMSRHRSSRANAMRWFAVHMAIAACRVVARRYVRVGFADLLNDPDGQLSRIAAAVLPGQNPPSLPQRSFEVVRSHIVEANPRRQKCGTVAIRQRAPFVPSPIPSIPPPA